MGGQGTLMCERATIIIIIIIIGNHYSKCQLSELTGVCWVAARVL